MPEIAKGLNDKYAPLRSYTMQKIATTPYKADKVVLEDIERIAKTDNNKLAKAAAINYLVKNGDAKYLPIYQAAINDSSYSVSGAALKGLSTLDPTNAYALAKKYVGDAKGSLGNEIKNVMYAQGNEADFDFIASNYREAELSFETIAASGKFAEYLTKLNDNTKIKTGVDYIIETKNKFPEQFKDRIAPAFQSALDKISKAKGGEIATYILSVNK